jgi:hypothetical protein
MIIVEEKPLSFIPNKYKKQFEEDIFAYYEHVAIAQDHWGFPKPIPLQGSLTDQLGDYFHSIIKTLQLGDSWINWPTNRPLDEYREDFMMDVWKTIHYYQMSFDFKEKGLVNLPWGKVW